MEALKSSGELITDRLFPLTVPLPPPTTGLISHLWQRSTQVEEGTRKGEGKGSRIGQVCLPLLLRASGGHGFCAYLVELQAGKWLLVGFPEVLSGSRILVLGRSRAGLSKFRDSSPCCFKQLIWQRPMLFSGYPYYGLNPSCQGGRDDHPLGMTVLSSGHLG